MYDINTKFLKRGILIFGMMLMAFLVLLLLLIFLFVDAQIKLNSIDSKVIATKVEFEEYESDGTTTYLPIYYYTVNGIEYSCSGETSSNIGTSNKTIYYDFQNPSKCITKYEIANKNVYIFFIIAFCVPVIIFVIEILKIMKRVKVIKKLNKTGKLVKNIPYTLQETGASTYKGTIYKPVINYVLSNGITVKLYGDSRYDYKVSDEDGMVDLVIDENNPDIYFIDFEINRLTGNLPSDYYNDQNISENDLNK